jgi:DNA-directed RNA polymerase specialized sigma subunit
MDFSNLLERVRCAHTLRAAATNLETAAQRLRQRADTLDRTRHNARFSISDYRDIVRAANAASELVSLGFEPADAAHKVSIHYDIPASSVLAHLDTLLARKERAAMDAKKRTAKSMTARSIPQRRIAKALGVSQPRVSQLIRQDDTQ